MFKRLFETLQPASLILTANNRLASTITQQYHDHHVFLDHSAWESLDILPITSWLQRCWMESQTCGIGTPLTLLYPFQEQLLWQDIIRKSSQNALLNICSTAKLAQRAWDLLNQWNISLSHSFLQNTPDSQNFTDWTKQLINTCDKNQWLDNARLISHIHELFNNNRLPIPSDIILIGFLEPTPAQKNLFNCLKEKGSSIHFFITTSSHTPRTVQLASTDTETEIYSMAHWAKEIAEKDHQFFIGCVIHELNENRKTIERIFNKVFSDKTELFNLSSGNPLIDEPIIYTAFEILRFSQLAISMNDLSYLLYSPFLDYDNEQLDKACFDALLRKKGNTEYQLSQLIDALSHNESQCHHFLIQLQNFQNVLFKKKQMPSVWAQTFLQLLSAIKWPGERTINSREYQAIMHWHQALEQLSRIDFLQEQISFTKALYYLRQLASQITFQQQTKNIPRIQVLGTLEAAGIPFTHIWMMGLDDQHWPANAKPNPLLPIALQRQYDMPHNSAQREHHFSKLIMRIFNDSAKTIIYSYSKNNGDQLLHVSPLIQHFPTMDYQIINPKQNIFSNITLEEINNEQGPTITTQEVIHGGTSIFKAQSACPFKAFVQHRLHAVGLEEPSEGLTSLERGRLLHKALEIIWKMIKTSLYLKTLLQQHDQGNETFIKIIETSIEDATYKILHQRKLKKGFIELEKQRLKDLLLKYLRLENTRETFEVIAFEHWQEVIINHLKIHTQIDRIDRLSDKTYAVIDYKTGKTQLNSWFGERPDEPQLPLYVTSTSEPISSMAFAQIRPEETIFKGISTQKNILPNDKILSEIKHTDAKSTWNEQLQSWKQTLEKLADDFCHGKAKIDPKNKNTTCQFCDLKSLCRIDEQ